MQRQVLVSKPCIISDFVSDFISDFVNNLEYNKLTIND